MAQGQWKWHMYAVITTINLDIAGMAEISLHFPNKYCLVYAGDGMFEAKETYMHLKPLKAPYSRGNLHI